MLLIRSPMWLRKQIGNSRLHFILLHSLSHFELHGRFSSGQITPSVESPVLSRMNYKESNNYARIFVLDSHQKIQKLWCRKTIALDQHVVDMSPLQNKTLKYLIANCLPEMISFEWWRFQKRSAGCHSAFRVLRKPTKQTSIVCRLVEHVARC